MVLSDAAQCAYCTAYHYPLPIIPEVVDVRSREPIPQGTGGLVLTELHPYAQLQLLVRYWTDDLVELAEPCPLGGFGIRVRGRRSSSVVIDRAEGPALVIGSLQVGEVVAEVPDVATTTITWAPWAVDAGGPRFSLDADGATVGLTVELRFRPESFPARADAVIEEITASLRAEVTGLAAALDDETVDLRLRAVGPGALAEPTKV